MVLVANANTITQLTAERMGARASQPLPANPAPLLQSTGVDDHLVGNAPQPFGKPGNGDPAT